MYVETVFGLFLFVFSCVSVFSATQRQSDSGSSQLGKPSVKFKEWQIGRSRKNTDSKNNNPTSFITSTQDKCHFTASVVYNGNQGDNVSPIDPSTVSWTVIDADPSSMKLDASSVQKNWSGRHPFVSEDLWRSRAALKNETTGKPHVLSIGGVLEDFTVMKIQGKHVTLDHHGNPPVVLHLSEPVLLNPKRR